MKKLVMINTVYSLFIDILLNHSWKKNIYVFDRENFNEKDLDFFYKNKLNFTTFVPIKKDKKIIKNVCNYFKYIISIIKIIIYILKENIKIINGSDSVLPLSLKFKLEFQYLIEDGMLNYKLPKDRNDIKKKIIDFLLLRPINYKPFGYSKNIKKIYLTGLAPIPEEIKAKVEIINLKELWNKKTKEEKEEILDIFNFNENIINTIKNKKNILFTQPLSEDGFISEEEKVNLYKRIISNYKKEELVIKTHPREKTNYKEYFPNVEILNQSFPAELLDLLDINFEKVITIFSTAALNFSKNAEMDFYGTKIHSQLLKLWGDSDKIMKANKFLELDEE